MTPAKQKITKAVFPVAGLGTRFLPATKAIPKEMIPIIDKPLIQYAVEEAIEAGITEFIFITSKGKVAITNHFDYMPELEDILSLKGKTKELEAVRNCTLPAGQMMSTRQSEALGLGHAVWCAKNFVGDEPFAVLLPDDLFFNTPNCLKQLVDRYFEVGGNLAAVTDVERKDTSRYGILKIKKDDGALVSASDLVEKPTPESAPSNVAILGRYILSPTIFSALDKQIIGSGGEIQLTDALTATMDKTPFTGVRFIGEHFDCGSMEGWLKANIYMGLELPETRDLITNYIKEKGFRK